MVVGAKVCDLTEDLLWFVCGTFDVFPKWYGPLNSKEKSQPFLRYNTGRGAFLEIDK